MHKTLDVWESGCISTFVATLHKVILSVCLVESATII